MYESIIYSKSIDLFLSNASIDDAVGYYINEYGKDAFNEWESKKEVVNNFNQEEKDEISFILSELVKSY